ncbi:MAG: hypothetical protein Q7K55_07780 [Candidatus Levybacteria bacterium]|nr:hypothetical protein [Candidatus Levybacteria bacterium]
MIKKKRKKINFIPVIIFFVFCLIFSVLLAARFLIFDKSSFISPVPGILSVKGQKIVVKNISGNNFETILKKSGINYSYILYSSDFSYVAKLESGEEIIFSAKKDVQAQVSSLQLIHSRLKIEGKRFVRLDLRYDKPVVVFQ